MGELALSKAVIYGKAVLAVGVAIVFVMLGCGDSESDALRNQVASALESTTYDYMVLPEQPVDDYLLFRASRSSGGPSVNIAFGGERSGSECTRIPPLPARHRSGGKPFSAAGPEPLICFEDDAWRPGASERATVVRTNIANEVATLLCEESYDPFTCFD